MHQNQTKTSAATTKHPSGLSWERWHWPFKTKAERAAIEWWLVSRGPRRAPDGTFQFDPNIPF